MLPITNILGETHLLTGVKQVSRKKKVNGEKTISFVVIPTGTNNHSFESVDNESRIVFDKEPYIIKRIQERNIGNTSIKQVEAVHAFFNDMINSYQYDMHSGSQTFFAAMQRVFGPTDYTFSIVDSFSSKEFDNFGRDNCLSLFKTALDRYGAEFEVIGKRVYLKEKIGADTGFQLRWKKNIKSIEKQVNTDGLATVIRGFGGKPDDNGIYPIEREYRSLNESIFGELHATAVYDERITTITGMDERLKKDLIDEPQLSITVHIAEIDGDVKNEGDSGFIIYEPMNVKLKARAVEIDETFEFFEKEWNVIQTAVTLANLRTQLKDITTRFANTSKRLDRLFEGRESLPYNVLPEAMRIAAEAINNSLTEIQYPPGQGMVLRDPNDDNLLVRLTSAGIGLSEDGGQTYRSALTGAGIVTNELVAGVIRTNNIQIVGEDDLFYWNGEGLFAYDPNDLTRFVRLNSDGLYIAKGAITIERPDGYKTINNGMSTFDVNIQGVEPTFHSPAVTLVQKSYAQWLSTRTASTSVDFNQYSFKHEARYLKVRFRILASGSNTAHFEIWKDGTKMASAQTGVSNENDPSILNGSTLTVDLGVPTGNADTFQIRFRTSESNVDAYAMVTRKWLEG